MFESYDKTKVQRVETEEPEKIIAPEDLCVSEEDIAKMENRIKKDLESGHFFSALPNIAVLRIYDPDFRVELTADQKSRLEAIFLEKPKNEDDVVEWYFDLVLAKGLFKDLLVPNWSDQEDKVKESVRNEAEKDSAGYVVGELLLRSCGSGLSLLDIPGFDPKSLEKELEDYKKRDEWGDYAQLAGAMTSLFNDFKVPLDTIDWDEVRATLGRLEKMDSLFEKFCLMISIEKLRAADKKLKMDEKANPPIPIARKF